jgi:hypothetical protein
MDIKKNSVIDKKIVKIAKLVFICTGLFSSIHSFASTLHSESLIQLNDAELSDVSGQALMSLSYIAPNDSINNIQGQDVGFYKLGLEAELDLNANIKKLQLGCGGVNGAGGCDIDIDNLSLSGIADTREGRVGSSAKLTNPFVEFAIKNPNSASTREVVGLRLSAEKVLGLLTTGIENSDLPNGINSLSGAIKIKATTGTGFTAPRAMRFNDTGMAMSGRIIIGFVAPTFTTNNYNLQLQSTKANLLINGTTLAGTRLTSAKLTGTALIDNLNFGGNITARVNLPFVSLIPLSINSNGYISGLRADLDIEQDLGYIHKFPLNNPFSLSLQSTQVHWPGAEYAANRGWWLAIEDEIDIGKVIPKNQIDVTNDILKQVVPSINNYLTNNPPTCQLAIGCIALGLNIGEVNLSSAKPLYFPIKDLPLATQGFAPNCYGNLKFC